MTKPGLIVRFTDPDEYLEDLQNYVYPRLLTPRSERTNNSNNVRALTSVANVAIACMHLTNLIEPMKMCPNVRLIRVVATYAVGGQIVRLDRFCGEDWGNEFESSAETIAIAKKVENKIRAVCKKLNIAVRAGILEHEP